MKYFTIKWWAGDIDDQMAAFDQYSAYLREAKPRFSPELRRLIDDVSLHDSRLRRLHLSPESKELMIDLDGSGANQDHSSFYPLKIRLAYRGVMAFESLADPEIGLGGPHGYGDLGYDEIGAMGDGRFQHRMLFSSGIEFSVTFTDFSLVSEKQKEPNNAMERSRILVTDHAVACSAPSIRLAHLGRLVYPDNFEPMGSVAKRGTCRSEEDSKSRWPDFSKAAKRFSDFDHPENGHGEAPQKFPNPISALII